MCSSFRVGVDVRCYIVYYYYYILLLYIIYYIILLYYILYIHIYIIYYILYYIIHYILYYTLPSLPFPSLFFPLSSSLISSSSFSSLLLFHPLPSSHLFLLQSSHSFYTCRYLHILIYIPDSSKNNLTPHVLSEWMVEVCRFDKYRYLRFGVLRCVGFISIRLCLS